jgi:hypothetical protein
MKIRFVVQTMVSAPDINGNRSRFARITSTATGRSMVIDDVGGDENAPHMVMRAMDCGYDAVMSIVQDHIPRKLFRAMRANAVSETPRYENALTWETLVALEKSE